MHWTALWSIRCDPAYSRHLNHINALAYSSCPGGPFRDQSYPAISSPAPSNYCRFNLLQKVKHHWKLTMEPSISVDHGTLKAAIRDGLISEVREYWWPILTQIAGQTFKMKEYPDVAGSAQRLLSMSSTVSPMVAFSNDNSIDTKHYLLLETLRSAKSMGDSKL